MTLDEIVVLHGLQGVRMRPAMYLADLTQPTTVNKLLEEALCISLDAIQTGMASILEIEFHANGSVRVADNSLGLELTPDEWGVPFPQRLLTELFACSHNKSEETRHFCGHGIVCTNAFSAWLNLDVFKNGVHWKQAYLEGEAVGPLAAAGATNRQGNQLHFLPDASILPHPQFDKPHFANWFTRLEVPNTHISISADFTQMTMNRTN